MIEFKDKMRSMYKFFMLFFCCAVAMAQDTIIPLWPKEILNRIETDVKEIHEKGDMFVIRKVSDQR
ncbi:hypothetical protein MNBD_BACTEROID03-2664 [hydrothermal vent metagenome]|uniref:Uncharacterized protein n=1 Tax=hydrothermal vent metagenome TaxID=652676 RepID=A0A3B0T3M5_9ZZZZ